MRKRGREVEVRPEGGDDPVRAGKAAKRGRLVIDYDAIRGDDLKHLREIWAKTLGRVSKGDAVSVRANVEKALDAFFTNLTKELEKQERSIDPAEAARRAQATKDQQLEADEERFVAEIERLEHELALLTRANQHNRSDLQSIVAQAVDTINVDRVLHSVPQIEPRLHRDNDEALKALRKETEQEFAKFVSTATEVSDETAQAARESKVDRLLTVWKQRAEDKSESTAPTRKGGKRTKAAAAAKKKKLAGAFG